MYILYYIFGFIAEVVLNDLFITLHAPTMVSIISIVPYSLISHSLF